jgi:hypothetical protein
MMDVLIPNQGNGIAVLTDHEIDQVDGGFVCGGLCVAGAFALGTAAGAGLAWLILS